MLEGMVLCSENRMEKPLLNSTFGCECLKSSGNVAVLKTFEWHNGSNNGNLKYNEIKTPTPCILEVLGENNETTSMKILSDLV